MPWTLVHPAAVLPLKRSLFTRLPFDALVIGSMSPDLGYYVGAWRLAARAHAAAGVPLLCLPLGLLVYAVIRHLYAPLTALLPDPHRRALGSLRFRPLNSVPQLLLACLALLIGAVTHNVWDSFTHNNGTAVALLPWLRTPVMSVGGYVFEVCNLLQHVSSVIGAALLVLAYRRWLQERSAEVELHGDPQRAAQWRRLGLMLLLAVLIAALYQATLVWGRAAHGWMAELVRLVISATSVFAAILVVSALAVRHFSRRSEVG